MEGQIVWRLKRIVATTDNNSNCVTCSGSIFGLPWFPVNFWVLISRDNGGGIELIKIDMAVFIDIFLSIIS